MVIDRKTPGDHALDRLRPTLFEFSQIGDGILERLPIGIHRADDGEVLQHDAAHQDV